jgi:hypothetical protein
MVGNAASVVATTKPVAALRNTVIDGLPSSQEVPVVEHKPMCRPA